MDSINSWINEDEVRKLARDLSAKPKAEALDEDKELDGVEDFTVPESSVNSSPEMVNDEVKEVKSNALAEASAMAASAGLIRSVMPKTTNLETQVLQKSMKDGSEENEAPLCDHCLSEVPGMLAENSKMLPCKVSQESQEKSVGTFEQIEQRLRGSVNSNGICVIDRDGDVLFASMSNPYFVSLVVDTAVGGKLFETEDGKFENIRLKVSASEYLEFISVKSQRGVLVLSLSSQEPLGYERAGSLALQVLEIANAV